jgi:hypothetical protein
MTVSTTAKERQTMKNYRAALALFCVSMLLTAGTTCSPALAFAPPANHEKLLEDKEYKDYFDRYTASRKEAKGRLSPVEYAELEKKIDEDMAESLEEAIASGWSETEAWSVAYMTGSRFMDRELAFHWLRKNTPGIQGYYKLKSDAFDGYMTVEEIDDLDNRKNYYAVNIYVVQKGGAEKNGLIEGGGQLEGKKIPVDFGGDECQTVTVNFDGETATVETSEEFRDSGWLDDGVVLHGEYVREKK